MPLFTYLHIDCDLYAGARDVLTILASRIAPGCLLIFDDVSGGFVSCLLRMQYRG